MKTRVLGTAILAVCAAMITYGASGCAADLKSNGIFTQGDLQGKWNIFLQTDNRLGYNYAYMTVNIDELGGMTCEYLFTNYDNSTCETLGTLPGVTMFDNGLIAVQGAPLYGTMNNDKLTVNLAAINEEGVWGTGIMSKAADNFSAANLAGKWNLLLLGNGYDDYGLGYVSMQVDEWGQAKCLSIFTNNSGVDNLSCDALTMPSLSITPNGLIEIGNTSIYGLMGLDGNEALLTHVAEEGAAGMGAMLKTTDDFTSADLVGEWIVTLFDNGNTGNGWMFIQMSVTNDLGETACQAYFDSDGNDSCDAIALPDVSISKDGIIHTGDAPVHGIMNADRDSAYLVTVTEEGVIQTGTLTRR